MNTAATQVGAPANPQQPPVVIVDGDDPSATEEKQKPVDVRNNALDDISDRFEASRRTEIDEAVETDPGLAQNQKAIDDELVAANKAIAEAEGVVADPVEEVITEPVLEPEPIAEPLPTELKDDPLKDFIAMRDGVAMFVTKVDGNEVLIPLDKARAQLQKHTAAEVRLQNVNTMKQQLDERETAISANEVALQNRIDKLSAPPPEPSGVDDQALDNDAKSLVSTLFTGTEDEAVEAMKDVLSKNRTPVIPASPVVDQDALVAQTATAVRTQITQEARDSDAQTGFKQFQSDYPDIMADVNLYRMADAMTDEIALENPEWKLSQVMDEAGKKTREWMDSVRIPTPGKVETPVASVDRQTRKAKLVPMPKPASAVQPAPAPESPQTPADALAEMRKTRNQP